MLVQFDASAEIDLFDYVGIKQDLEEVTGRQVDLVQEGQELSYIQPTNCTRKSIDFMNVKPSKKAAPTNLFCEIPLNFLSLNSQ